MVTPAITSFSLPRGWEETQEPTCAIPGQHIHRYHPKGNMKVLLHFCSAGARLDSQESRLFRSLLYEKGALPRLDDVALKSVVQSAAKSKLLEIESVEVISWNGRNVLECRYTADAAAEFAFKNTGVKELHCWALVYDNAESRDAKVCLALPASIEFAAEEHDFKTNLQTVQFAAKTILWNKDWPPPR